MKFLKKYTNLFATVNLLVQLFILSFTSLHNHKRFTADFNETSPAIKSYTVSITDPFLNEHGQCSLVEFAHSVYSSLVASVKVAFTPNDNKIIYQAVESQHYSSLFTLLQSPRSPPLS